MNQKTKWKSNAYDIIAIISAVGVITWIITDFYGGMFIWLLSYGIIIIPLILLYIFSILDTIISIIRKGKKTSKIKLASHSSVLLSILIFNIYHSEVFKSDRLLEAVLKDDLCHHHLIFRKDGIIENQVTGIFGYSETFYGKYMIEDNLIIFSKRPYDNKFIPDTLLIDRKQRAIFREKDAGGNFITEKRWLNHFKIEMEVL